MEYLIKNAGYCLGIQTALDFLKDKVDNQLLLELANYAAHKLED